MISLIKNSSYGGTIAILVASFLWGTTGTAAAFAPTLGPLAIGAVAMGGGGLLQALIASPAIREHRQFIGRNISIILLGVWQLGYTPSFLFFHALCRNYDWYGGFQLVRLHSLQQFLERFFDRKVLSKTWFLSFCVGCCRGKFVIYGRKPRSTESTNEWNKIFGIFLGW
ncbi:hypothetical protein ABVN80_02875 [Acinetobacter baumannii]